MDDLEQEDIDILQCGCLQATTGYDRAGRNIHFALPQLKPNNCSPDSLVRVAWRCVWACVKMLYSTHSNSIKRIRHMTQYTCMHILTSYHRALGLALVFLIRFPLIYLHVLTDTINA